MKAWVQITNDENQPITPPMPIDENGLIPYIGNHGFGEGFAFVNPPPARIPIRSMMVMLHYQMEQRRNFVCEECGCTKDDRCVVGWHPRANAENRNPVYCRMSSEHDLCTSCHPDDEDQEEDEE